MGSLRSNPWAREEKHAYYDILNEARNSKHHQLLPHNEAILRYNRSTIAHGLSVIRQANQTLNQLHEAQLFNLKMELENFASDILRSEDIARELDAITKTLEGFQMCVTHSSTLRSVLQQSFQVNYMKVEKSYHQDVKDLFRNAANCLSNLSTELTVLQWHKDNSINNTSLKETIKTLSKIVIDLRKSCEALEMRTVEEK